LCNSWTATVEPENRRNSKIKFTVTRLDIEAAERKPSMDDLSPAWKVQPDFVKLDYRGIANMSEKTTPPFVPHIIHQVCHVN